MSNRFYYDQSTNTMRHNGKVLNPDIAVKLLNAYIDEIADLQDMLKTEDNHHTMEELYEFRMMYNALLFNSWFANGIFTVYKSKRHYDGEECFDGNWFIVVAILPTGQITQHYHIDNWDLFKIPTYSKVAHPFDNHTSQDVLFRMRDLIEDEQFSDQLLGEYGRIMLSDGDEKWL